MEVLSDVDAVHLHQESPQENDRKCLVEEHFRGVLEVEAQFSMKAQGPIGS